MRRPDPGHADSAAGIGVSSLEKSQPSARHVAVIMDGNGRWASDRGRPRIEGHHAGTENVRRVLEAFARRGVKYLTLFAFSTENWDRPHEEVQGLFEILREVIDRETQRLHEESVKIRHLGRLDRLSPPLQRAIRDSSELTKNNTGINLGVAFNYGGRAEILDAVRSIVAEGIAPEDITDDVFRRHLYTSDIPDPDLIIRTAGELRLSNFLLWQSAYAEYYTTPVLWPDFDAQEVDRALEAYGQRQRRFGRVVPNRPARSRR